MDSFDLLSATEVPGRNTTVPYRKMVSGDVILYMGVAYRAIECGVRTLHLPCPSCAMYNLDGHIRCPRIECQGNFKNGIILEKL